MATKSPAKKLMIDLVKNVPMEGEFKYLTPPGEGQKMLHRIRVELSRARGFVKKQKVALRKFKIVFVSSRNIKQGDKVYEETTVKKTQTAASKMSSELMTVIHDLSLGPQLE